MRVVNSQVVVNKRVLVRLDLDVPLENGRVTDTTRIDAAKQTVDILKENARQVIYCGHMGRPKGRLDPKLSLQQLLPILEERFGVQMVFDDTYLAQEKLHELTTKHILFENLRFFAGEEENDPAFAKKLADIADVFVNEAFGVAHRTQASTVGVASLLPSYAGLHVSKEVIELSTVLHSPLKPFIVILGGAKLETKLPVIEQLKDTAEAVLVGGLLAKEIHDNHRNLGENVIVATLGEDEKDIDQASQERFATIISKAQTIVWNGPLGKFEEPKYMAGTKAIADAVTASGAYTIIGGGDTVAALAQLSVLEKLDFVSVGGGAMLEFLSGQPLPALVALEKH